MTNNEKLRHWAHEGGDRRRREFMFAYPPEGEGAVEVGDAGEDVGEHFEQIAGPGALVRRSPLGLTA
jgi:hypothetical protein